MNIESLEPWVLTECPKELNELCEEMSQQIKKDIEQGTVDGSTLAFVVLVVLPELLKEMIEWTAESERSNAEIVY